MNWEDLNLLERSWVYKFNRHLYMSNIFRLNWKDVAGAVVSAVLSAVLVYIANLTSISNLDWHAVLGIAITVAATSLLKAFGTTAEGKFAGAVLVK